MKTDLLFKGYLIAMRAFYHGARKEKMIYEHAWGKKALSKRGG